MLDEPRGHVAKVKLSTYLVAALAKCYLPCIRHTRPGHTHTHTASQPIPSSMQWLEAREEQERFLREAEEAKQKADPDRLRGAAS